MSSHIFSLYSPLFFVKMPNVGQQVIINDLLLLHRIVKVLRLSIAESLILFDQQHHATVKIIDIAKKNITVLIQSVASNQRQKSSIMFLLPLLKKDALELAVYSLCELGVEQIQLVITEKSRQGLLGDKEFDRLSGIVIAAAEQSKHYALSTLHKPEKLENIIKKNLSLKKIVFDVSGESFFKIVNDQSKNDSTITLLIGPEGGLTDNELKTLRDFKFKFCALTSTILRAVQAVVLGAGLFSLKN